jgi:hypothetical protein
VDLIAYTAHTHMLVHVPGLAQCILTSCGTGMGLRRSLNRSTLHDAIGHTLCTLQTFGVQHRAVVQHRDGTSHQRYAVRQSPST